MGKITIPQPQKIRSWITNMQEVCLSMSCGMPLCTLQFLSCVSGLKHSMIWQYFICWKKMKGCSLKEESRRHWKKPITSSQVFIFVNVKSMNLTKVDTMDFPSPISCNGGELCLQTFPLRNILLVCFSLLFLHREGRSGANVISKPKFIPEVITLQPVGLYKDQYNPSL